MAGPQIRAHDSQNTVYFTTAKRSASWNLTSHHTNRPWCIRRVSERTAVNPTSFGPVPPGCPLVQVCFTDEHLKLLKAELVQRVFTMMQEEGPLYQAGLAALLGKKTKGAQRALPAAPTDTEKKGRQDDNKDNKKKATPVDKAALLQKLKALQGGAAGGEEDEDAEEGGDEEEAE